MEEPGAKDKLLVPDTNSIPVETPPGHCFASRGFRTEDEGRQGFMQNTEYKNT